MNPIFIDKSLRFFSNYFEVISKRALAASFLKGALFIEHGISWENGFNALFFRKLRGKFRNGEIFEVAH